MILQEPPETYFEEMDRKRKQIKAGIKTKVMQEWPHLSRYQRLEKYYELEQILSKVPNHVHATSDEERDAILLQTQLLSIEMSFYAPHVSVAYIDIVDKLPCIAVHFDYIQKNDGTYFLDPVLRNMTHVTLHRNKHYFNGEEFCYFHSDDKEREVRLLNTRRDLLHLITIPRDEARRIGLLSQDDPEPRLISETIHDNDTRPAVKKAIIIIKENN